MNKKKIIALFGISFLLILLIGVGLFKRFHQSHIIEEKITIQKGMSSRQVAGLLAGKKIIASKKYFSLLLRLKGMNKKIKAGVFELSSGMSTGEIVDILVGGKVFYSKVTIPEGFTAKQVAQLLVEKNFFSSTDRFLQMVKEKNLEGYLFPETYFILPGTKEEEIIKIMTRQFFKIFTPQMKMRMKKFNFNQDEAVILASLIEKEAKDEKERNLISAVFHNRLKKRWRLESCASVRYVLDKWNEPLIYKDLEVNSPYNTYRYYGLPAGPVCNPGLASLKAALYPADSELMFFVAKGDGTHRFSKYYKEHLFKKGKN
ncbi:endolytic transglycosylase MltG [bacterium]|nr:endolytic transglycosylase MltG [bacterium]